MLEENTSEKILASEKTEVTFHYIVGTPTNPRYDISYRRNTPYRLRFSDFGIVKGYAQWINRKAVDTLNTNYFANRTAQQVGVRGYITPVVEGWAQVGNGKVSAFGANQPTANFVGYQAGANYWLSKRTNLYAIYGQNQTSSTSTVAGVSASNYAAGVRHTF